MYKPLESASLHESNALEHQASLLITINIIVIRKDVQSWTIPRKGYSEKKPLPTKLLDWMASKLLFGALLLVVFIAIVFLCSASFHRKETVIGYISPDNGLSKVLSPTTGVLQKLTVSTGDRITKGQPIALIKIPQHTASGQSVTTEMAQATTTQISN